MGVAAVNICARILRTSLIGLCLAVLLDAAQGAQGQSARAHALQAIQQSSPEVRRAGAERLGALGTMADADRLVRTLHDEDERVRLAATVAMWQIWSRSGDKAIDVLYQTGIRQMEAGDLQDAVATFTRITRRKPAFAEAWNKRATLFYMMGLLDLSLKDCDEVMKRNRNHFGALSGYGQIYLAKGELEKALVYFERALKINPDMPGAASAVLQLREHLQERRSKTI